MKWGITNIEPSRGGGHFNFLAGLTMPASMVIREWKIDKSKNRKGEKVQTSVQLKKKSPARKKTAVGAPGGLEEQRPRCQQNSNTRPTLTETFLYLTGSQTSSIDSQPAEIRGDSRIFVCCARDTRKSHSWETEGGMSAGKTKTGLARFTGDKYPGSRRG